MTNRVKRVELIMPPITTTASSALRTVPELVLIATGSEVQLAVAAAGVLRGEGVAVRVVSMPSTDRFDAQPAEYRDSVLPAGVPARVAIEAGVTGGWWRYVGCHGSVVGIDRFGASAPAAELFEYFGFTTDNVTRIARETLAASAAR